MAKNDKKSIEVSSPNTDFNTQDANIGMQLSGELRFNTNKAMRIILTQIEATLGDTIQAESFKKLVKHEFNRLIDINQHNVYHVLGVEKFNFKRAHEPNDEVTVELEEN